MAPTGPWSHLPSGSPRSAGCTVTGRDSRRGSGWPGRPPSGSATSERSPGPASSSACSNWPGATWRARPSGCATAGTATQRLADRHGLACLLSDQAVLYDYQNRAEEAARDGRARAMALFRAEGTRSARCSPRRSCSAAYRGLGRLDEALAVDRAAVAEAGELGAPEIVMARCLNALAVTRLLRDEPSLAYEAAERAVALLRTVGDRYVLLASLRHLASAALCLGRRAEAIRLLPAEPRPGGAAGDRPWATGLARDLAVSWIGEGRAAAAVEVLRECARTFEEMEMPAAQAATLQHARPGLRRARQTRRRPGRPVLGRNASRSPGQPDPGAGEHRAAAGRHSRSADRRRVARRSAAGAGCPGRAWASYPAARVGG